MNSTRSSRRALTGAILAVGVLAGCGGRDEPAAVLPTPPSAAAAEAIVYAERPDQYSDESHLVTVHPDGTGSRSLTFGGIDFDPAWSPDGSQIAYSSDQDVWVMHVDAPDGARSLDPSGTAAAGGFIRDPTWSPDGRRVAFVREWYDEGELIDGMPAMLSRGDLFVVDVRTGESKQLTDTLQVEASPAWSPDGTRLAFADAIERPPKPSGIFMLDLATGRSRRLADGGGPDWSPDGTTIAYSTRVGGKTVVALIDADGSGEPRIITSRDSASQPSWSPDGTQIVYVVERPSEEQRLIVIADADGRHPRVLVRGGTSPDWGLVTPSR